MISGTQVLPGCGGGALNCIDVLEDWAAHAAPAANHHAGAPQGVPRPTEVVPVEAGVLVVCRDRPVQVAPVEVAVGGCGRR